MAKQTFTTGQVLTTAQMTTLQTNDYNQTVSAKVASYTLVAADAGTRITMSNASATTITVNTGLFTAGDTLIITNIGAGVCTITAGTATVSTAGSLALNQYDSGTLYFTSTGVSIWNGANPGDITGITTGGTSGLTGGVTSGTADLKLAVTTNGDLLYGTGSGTVARLGIGSAAQVLTVASGVPSWATPAGGGGKVLQVITATTSTEVNNSTTTQTDSGLSLSITPSSASSKVLVMVYTPIGKSSGNANNGLYLRIMRGSTEILLTNVVLYTGTTLTNFATFATHIVDSPSTTSATTYKLQFANYNSGAAVTVQQNGAIGTIIAMEIGA